MEELRRRFPLTPFRQSLISWQPISVWAGREERRRGDERARKDQSDFVKPQNAVMTLEERDFFSYLLNPLSMLSPVMDLLLGNTFHCRCILMTECLRQHGEPDTMSSALQRWKELVLNVRLPPRSDSHTHTHSISHTVITLNVYSSRNLSPSSLVSPPSWFILIKHQLWINTLH